MRIAVDEEKLISACNQYGLDYRDAKYLTNVVVVPSRKSKIYVSFDKNCNTESTYTVFGGTKKFILNTITNKLKISDNKIELEYSLEGNKFKYLLEVVHEGKIKKSNK